MKRIAALLFAAALLTTFIGAAVVQAQDDGSGAQQNGTETPSETETATASETPSETETATASETETASETPSGTETPSATETETPDPGATPLVAGWNLIGAPSQSVTAFVEERNAVSPCSVLAIWRFEEDQTWSGWFSNAPELTDFDFLEPPNGYFVYCG